MKLARFKKPQKEWVVVQQENLRLVSDQVWDEAQKVRLGNQRDGFGHGPKRAAYLLTGLFHCSVCGNSVGGHWQENRDGSNAYYYYRCRGSMSGSKVCANKAKIRGISIESAIVDKIEAELFSKFFFERVIHAAAGVMEADNSAESGTLLAEKIAALDKRIANIARAIAVAPDVLELAQQAAAMNSERKTLQARIDQSIRKVQPDRAALRRRWSEIAGKTLSLLKKEIDLARLRAELQKWVESLRLDPDGKVWIKWKSSAVFEILDIEGLTAADLNSVAELQEWRALYLPDSQQN